MESIGTERPSLMDTLAGELNKLDSAHSSLNNQSTMMRQSEDENILDLDESRDLLSGSGVSGYEFA